MKTFDFFFFFQMHLYVEFELFYCVLFPLLSLSLPTGQGSLAPTLIVDSARGF